LSLSLVCVARVLILECHDPVEVLQTSTKVVVNTYKLLLVAT